MVASPNREKGQQEKRSRMPVKNERQGIQTSREAGDPGRGSKQ